MIRKVITLLLASYAATFAIQVVVPLRIPLLFSVRMHLQNAERSLAIYHAQRRSVVLLHGEITEQVDTEVLNALIVMCTWRNFILELHVVRTNAGL